MIIQLSLVSPFLFPSTLELQCSSRLQLLCRIQSLNVARLNTNSKQSLSLSLHTNQTHSSCPVTSFSPSIRFFNLASYTQAMSELHLSSIQLNDLFNAAQLSSNSTLAFNKLNESCNVTQSSINSTIAPIQIAGISDATQSLLKSTIYPNSTHQIARHYLIYAQFVNFPSINLSIRPIRHLNFYPSRPNC